MSILGPYLDFTVKICNNKCHWEVAKGITMGRKVKNEMKKGFKNHENPKNLNFISKMDFLGAK